MARGFIVGDPGRHPAEGANHAGVDGLTPAEVHALSRSAPLTPTQFKQQREVAERRNVPLHVLLERADAAVRHRSA
jgi:hypothetical protein